MSIKSFVSLIELTWLHVTGLLLKGVAIAAFAAMMGRGAVTLSSALSNHTNAACVRALTP